MATVEATATSRIDADSLSCNVRRFQAGRVSVPPLPSTLVLLHLSGPNKVVCRREGATHRGTEIYADIDLIPSGVATEYDGSTSGTSILTGCAADTGARPIVRICSQAAEAARLPGRTTG